MPLLLLFLRFESMHNVYNHKKNENSREQNVSDVLYPHAHNTALMTNGHFEEPKRHRYFIVCARFRLFFVHFRTDRVETCRNRHRTHPNGVCKRQTEIDRSTLGVCARERASNRAKSSRQLVVEAIHIHVTGDANVHE